MRAINTLNPPKNYIRKLGGLSPIHSTCWHGAQGLMWCARGPFWPAADMVLAVVTPVVFCAKATEKRNKNTKISWWLPTSLFITICYKTYCNSYIANSSVARARVVAWPEPEPLCSNGPRNIGYHRKALVIARMINAWENRSFILTFEKCHRNITPSSATVSYVTPKFLHLYISRFLVLAIQLYTLLVVLCSFITLTSSL